MEKSTIEEIKERFDNDVERFSNLETGQVSTIDATISLELITEAAKNVNTEAKELLDIGCGAGNYTLKMLTKIADLNCTLNDLSLPMLERAKERVSSQTQGNVTVLQGDIRTADLEEGKFDIILAGAVLHHLRDDKDWEETFTKLFKLLKKGGCLMISDLVLQENPNINKMIWEKYGLYLESVGGVEYREKVLDYIEKEDSPRSITYQLELMKKIGFSSTEILHKNLCFGAYGGVK
ncbi:trans-aconitate 2-methyltransferase [Flammeovirga sp. EKP202]|uniref:class I SAM-dependent methyltransferase n=1 Tax=Flammeovirga sp. EKP202 TaxID=2770592 RepID=UPI00165F502C|nr:class I SAM-dependent methyltransferase [Flammeovirga sp. EKP202]MBD0402133.1 class I SAM-dependent methyltransferase [Flammeovirga sp. EKP202]